MPIYEYLCGSCQHRFEVKKGFSEDPETPCPHCQGPARRVFHPVPVHYKGGGFYSTDHRPTNHQPTHPKPEESKAPPEDTKTEQTDKVKKAEVKEK